MRETTFGRAALFGRIGTLGLCAATLMLTACASAPQVDEAECGCLFLAEIPDEAAEPRADATRAAPLPPAAEMRAPTPVRPLIAGTVGAASITLQDDDVGSKGPGAGDYAMVVPENLVWWPWKIIGGTGKGLVDGVSAGFTPERLPILGLLFSPVNAVLGTVTGFHGRHLLAPRLHRPPRQLQPHDGLAGRAQDPDLVAAGVGATRRAPKRRPVNPRSQRGFTLVARSVAMRVRCGLTAAFLVLGCAFAGAALAGDRDVPVPPGAERAVAAANKARAARLASAPVDELLAALRSERRELRQVAARAASGRVGEDPRVLAELIEATGDDHPAVRIAATRSLGAAGDAARAAIPRLGRLARGASDARQVQAAAAALVRIPSASDVAGRLLRDPSGRANVMAGVAGLGPEGAAVLRRLSGHASWRVRVAAIEALADVDVRASATDGATDPRLDVVRDGTRDDSSAVRIAVLALLPRVRGAGELLTSADVERAFHVDTSPRERAQLLVALLQHEQPGAVPDGPLLHETVDRIGASELAVAHEVLTSVAPALLAGSPATRERTAVALARIAALGSPFALAAAERLRDADAVPALPPAALPAARRALAHPDARVAASVGLALARSGSHAPGLAPALARVVVGKSWREWREPPLCHRPGRRTLRRNLPAGPGDDSVLAAMRRAGVSASKRTPRLHCDDVVPALRARPAEARAALLPLLRHEYSATRAAAAWMLALTDEHDADAVSTLRPMLDDVVLSVRIVAALGVAHRSNEPSSEAGQAAVALLTDVLLRDSRGSEDPVVSDDLHPSTPMPWPKECCAALRVAPETAVDRLVTRFAERVSTTARGMTFRDAPGDRHVRPAFAAMGAPGHAALRNELARGGDRRRFAVAEVLRLLHPLDTEHRAAWRELSTDPSLARYLGSVAD